MFNQPGTVGMFLSASANPMRPDLFNEQLESLDQILSNWPQDSEEAAQFIGNLYSQIEEHKAAAQEAGVDPALDMYEFLTMVRTALHVTAVGERVKAEFRAAMRRQFPHHRP